MRGARNWCAVAGVFIAALGLSSPSSSQSCPGWRDPVGKKIVGGEKAAIGQWPSQAVLRLTEPSGSEAIYICGGSAVAADRVLTAAHCFDDIVRDADGRHVSSDTATKGWALDLLLGVGELARASEAESFAITDVTIHEEYRKHDVPVHGQDIALVHLTRPWKGPVATLSLDAANDPQVPPGAGVTVAGFGLLAGTPKGGGLQRIERTDGSAFLAGSPTLQQVGMPLVETAECAARWPGKAVGAGQICAGFEKGGKDSCGGDSGGPLVAYDPVGCPTHIGLVSWGATDCAAPKTYGVYTRLSHHAAWLRKHVPDVVAKSGVAPGTGVADLSPADFVRQATELLGPDRGHTRIGVRGGSTVKLGGRFAFEVTSDVAGHLVIVDVNADGVATQIFPNEFVAGPGASLIRPNELVVVPGPGYGFDAFRADPPAGKGQLIVLVVPKDFPVDPLLTAPRRVKGFTPERSAVGYFMNLLHQITGKLTAQRAAGMGQEPTWGIFAVDYEIVP